VTRKTPPLVAEFDKDPVGVVLGILREVDGPLGKKEILARLADGGVDPAAADKVWQRTVQEQVRFDDHVIFAKQKYQWTSRIRDIPLEERIYRLTRNPDPSTPKKLMELVRVTIENTYADPVALDEARQRAADAERRIAELQRRIDELVAATPSPAAPPPAEPAGDAHAQYERAERRRLARERQARIDAMSTVAELAAEVEELTAKQAAPEVLLEHTRALTGGRGLEAIGRAGQEIPYEEAHHEPVGEFPNDGEPVTVIRPGYLWHAPGEAVLISKALVTRAKGASGR
jgi:pyruvate/2-oxoglutarate dehydrogenase complex dihydrolipoamide acyltransferase (E2) component